MYVWGMCVLSLSLLPWLQLGASGYGFLVDNNGQLVNHPLISLEYIRVRGELVTSHDDHMTIT